MQVITNNIIFKLILKHCWEFDENIQKEFFWCPLLNENVETIYSYTEEYNLISKPNPIYKWKINLMFVSKNFFRIIATSFPFQISSNSFYLHFKEELEDKENNNNNYEINLKLLNNRENCNNNNSNNNNNNNNINLFEENYQTINKIQKNYYYFKNIYEKMGVVRFKNLFKDVKQCQIEYTLDEAIELDMDIINNIGDRSTAFIFSFLFFGELEKIFEDTFRPISNSNLNIETIAVWINPNTSYRDHSFSTKALKIITYCKKTLKKLYILDQAHLTHFSYVLEDLFSVETLFLGATCHHTFGRPIFNLRDFNTIKEITFQSELEIEYFHYHMDGFSSRNPKIKHFNYNILAKNEFLGDLSKNLKELESLAFCTDNLELDFFQLTLPPNLVQLSIKIQDLDFTTTLYNNDSVENLAQFFKKNNSIKYLNFIFEKDAIINSIRMLKVLFNQALNSLECNIEYLSISYNGPLEPPEDLLKNVQDLLDSIGNNNSLKGILFYYGIDSKQDVLLFPDLIKNYEKDLLSPIDSSVYYKRLIN
ncbi:hypothetical protein DICPUDRAFT_153390 [Dictyostelium purpureum]|uniref:Uncharacterized protein n=1 Tax=Dictyostelium purpureum TaxID=5786 RepID=F0ZNS5_DICPU|nr:uncharacterized protein DICPUDRAFT_153390 [Dictyostelium purpureum]EGC34391.1 hypothetical protein DICPUDRAFT_153390 [Dictyostelium purpureum]|eukprot:XP_003289065.1 hypothetical protein DICPUDRAFT_153390 [Dictyostelium purpureum]